MGCLRKAELCNIGRRIQRQRHSEYDPRAERSCERTGSRVTYRNQFITGFPLGSPKLLSCLIQSLELLRRQNFFTLQICYHLWQIVARERTRLATRPFFTGLLQRSRRIDIRRPMVALGVLNRHKLQEQSVLEVLAHTREILDDWNIECSKIVCWADT